MSAPTTMLAAPAPRRRRRCSVHELSLPCRGCRADQLAGPRTHHSPPRPAPYLDAKMRAAGEEER